MSFQNFLLNEKLGNEHAERYLRYIDMYHQEVWADLHLQLTNDWKAEIANIIEAVDPIEDMIIKRELRVPGIISKIELVIIPERVSTTRSRGIQQVSPSVKIPYIYHQETIDLLLKRLLKVSQKSFQNITTKWSEIFNYEKRQQVYPGFKIEMDDLNQGVKFKITSSIGGEEIYKTIYSVNIEHGKSESKIRSFDRIYLQSHI